MFEYNPILANRIAKHSNNISKIVEKLKQILNKKQ